MRHMVGVKVGLWSTGGLTQVSVVMGGFYCGLAIQTFVVCEQHPSWKDLALPQCPLGKEVAIAQLISELV